LAGRLAAVVADSEGGVVAAVSVAGLVGPPQERRVKQSIANRILRVIVVAFYFFLKDEEIDDANLNHKSS
jgi:hypothetical protein